MSRAALNSTDAERLRAFERQGHDALAAGYHSFFAAVTALANKPLLDAVHLRPGMHLLDVATGIGALGKPRITVSTRWAPICRHA